MIKCLHILPWIVFRMAQDMVLYWASGSPHAWKVQIALEEKGLQGYTSKLISFEKGENKSDEIRKVNPRGQVRFIVVTTYAFNFTPGAHVTPVAMRAPEGLSLIL